MDPLIGKTIVRYKISNLLGEGGMGSVYKARDITLQRDVAIKLMHAQYSRQEAFQERFLQEARTAARFRNPNIVQVFDFGQSEDQLYIVMEFIPGDNLAVMLQKLRQKGKWLLLPEAVHLVRQICLAIDYAHTNGVLHRDIKPNNIMIDPEPADGLPYHPVITDLGLAKLAEGGVMTQEGSSMGTPAYMSPEQALGQKTDNRSDIYSLGVLLYELTVGKLPFPATNLAEAIQYHTKAPVPSPRLARPGFPPELEAIILKTLEKEPANRYQSAAGLAKALADAPILSTVVSPSTNRSEDEGVSLVTVHESAGNAKLRGDSVLNDFTPLPEANLDRIQIMAPEQTSIFITVKKKTLTIGRDADNEIVLIDRKASRHHARIEIDLQGGRPGYRVIDLDSSNGTFLGASRLLPGVAENWTPDKALKVGDSYLRLVPGEADQGAKSLEASIPLAQSQSARGRTQMDPGNILSSSGQGRVGVYLDSTNLNVEPGQSISCAITLFNQGSIVDHFIASLQGLPSGWVIGPLNPVQLLPGDQKSLAVNILPPRKPENKAGSYPFVIRVASQSAPDQAVEAKATLNLGSFSQFTAELRPQRVAQANPARISVQNQGNAPETFQISFNDRGDELVYNPPVVQLKVPEGQVASAEVRIAPRQPKLYGAGPVFPFNVKVTSPKSETQSLSGELASKARIPAWLPPVLLVLCLCVGAVGAGLAALSGNFNPGISYQPTAISAAVPSLTPSPTNSVPTSGPGATQTPPPTNEPSPTPTETPSAPAATEAPGAGVANLTVRIVHPAPGEYEPSAKVNFLFQVIAFDPAVGSKDGDGIQDVQFSILDSRGNLVYQHTEKTASYCAFGGGDANNPQCNLLTFATSGNRWPNGAKIAPDEYTLQAHVTSLNGVTYDIDTKSVLNPPDRIAYVSEQTSNSEIYIMNSDGSNVTRLTNDPAQNHPWYAWSHDGRRLAFISGSTINNGETGQNDIYVVNPDGSGIVNVTNQPFSHLSVSWSPDDKTLLFSSNQENSNRDIYLVNPDGSNLRNLTDNPAYDTQPHWSPDGRVLFRSDRSGHDEYYIVNPDGSNLQQVTFNNLDTIQTGGFSPDGRQILLVLHFSNDQIYSINADGSGQTNLTNNTLLCSSPEWSPDGNRILYTCYETNTSISNLFIMNRDGSAQTQITSGVDVQNPHWTPDGHGFVFDTNRDGNYEIYLLDEQGNNWTRLTNNNVSDYSPGFMP